MSTTICGARSQTDFSDFERIYEQWDSALSHHDPEALVALYASDATLESPLVPHLMRTESGVCRGHAELRAFFEILVQRKANLRRYHRTAFLTDGQRMMWEYPRSAPDGDQLDFVEVMELRDGMIEHHRVYWGWYGARALQWDACSH